MNVEFLDRLAHQLKAHKTPSCRRAINRILEQTKKRCEDGKYNTPMAAESDFRELVEKERACHHWLASFLSLRRSVIAHAPRRKLLQVFAVYAERRAAKSSSRLKNLLQHPEESCRRLTESSREGTWVASYKSLYHRNARYRGFARFNNLIVRADCDVLQVTIRPNLSRRFT
jgi:hypothetical protein